MSDESVDTKNGYTMVANALLEAIVAHPFSKLQYQVVLHVLRRTYGFKKKSDDMSYGQIATATGMRRQHAIRTVKELSEMNVLAVEKSGKFVRGGELNNIGLNKHFDTWRTSPKKRTSPKEGLVPKNASTSPKNGSGLVPKSDPTKETLTKENTKEKIDRESESPKASRTSGPSSEEMFAAWYAEYPRKVAKQQAWKAWKSIKPDAALARTMIKAVRQQKRWRDQARDIDPDAFIPEWKHPGTWLNGGCWEDDVDLPQPQGRPSEQRRTHTDYVMTGFD